MPLSVQTVIDKLCSSVPPISNTVDILMAGQPDTEVRGIAVSFMPTQQVIEKAIALGANLLITHEPLSYSHRHEEKLIENDPIYAQKQKLIAESGIAIFRYHDYCHRKQPDIIMTGLLAALEWESHLTEMLPIAAIVELPSLTVTEVAAHAKQKLGMPFLRITGDLSTPCRRAGILVGYRGGASTAIPFMREHELDLLIVGEGPEWETPEYIRDASYQGRPKALLTLGHAESEEPGMRALSEELRRQYPEVAVEFIPIAPIFRIV
ncbi:Nif3-like dinuclear metal center hexameric protein [Paenibacillus glycanilyticus]|uniref:Nif3-like dinuclear metal center hexameric protein n=1 Tax=Paenibacillus glycanilyticus TaxID=126569 RepID=UPI00203EC701|nr:Nif3-like dinuclear metal center hexameric protein [Paenibacillus glycanilyticus]MCM3630613.1 Nif3-like dinuclear metal center hexameric protein [Paenibacillus glycanilyticus]